MRLNRVTALLALGLLLLTTYRFAPAQASYLATPPAATAQFASPLFERVWSRTDAPVAANIAHRSWTWGPGPGPTREEPFAGAPNGTRQVQYFDKGRMEVNPAVKDPNSPWAATSGLLVVELVSGQIQTGPNQFEARGPADVPVVGEPPAPGDARVPTYRSFASVASLPGGPDRRAPVNKKIVVGTINRDGAGQRPLTKDINVSNVAYVQETGHNVPDVFWSFMAAHGLVLTGGVYDQRQLFDPVFVLGYPITEAYWTTAIINGKPTEVLVQLFQRRVLTFVPSFPPAWQVQMGNVGQHYYQWRYGQPLPAAAPVAVTNAPPLPPADAFVHVEGDQLVLRGQPITIKGTNYWLHDAPFVTTWAEWDAPTVKAELGKAHELGVNTVRITLPYDYLSLRDTVWGDKASERINGPIINLMTQFLQIAASYDMKVIFALFDATDRIEELGDADKRIQLNYVQGLVEPFANDDRVLAWDLRNEPDNGVVGRRNPTLMIGWLNMIAQAVRSIDTRHPITVGMGNYENLWQAPRKLAVLDFVDFASFHSYDAGRFADQIGAVKAHTKLPILVSEFGWPTGPAAESTAAATYDEPTQQGLYRTMLGAARAAGIAGMMQWTLWDYGKNAPQRNYEAHFGLVRLDGSFKPAAADFRDGYPAPPLPSVTRTNVPLTPHGVEPQIGP
jgi:hypothetical protein